MDRPDENALQEMLGLLRVRGCWAMRGECPCPLHATVCCCMLQLTDEILQTKTSMLAVGAAERIKRVARVFPKEICASDIPGALVAVIETTSPLAGAAMAALTTLATAPEGRQVICLQGGVPPLVRWEGRNTA